MATKVGREEGKKKKDAGLLGKVNVSFSSVGGQVRRVRKYVVYAYIRFLVRYYLVRYIRFLLHSCSLVDQDTYGHIAKE